MSVRLTRQFHQHSDEFQEYSQDEADTAFRRTAAAHNWGSASVNRQQPQPSSLHQNSSAGMTFSTRSHVQQQVQAAAGSNSAALPTLGQVSIPQSLSNPKKPLSLKGKQALQALKALQTAQVEQAVQAASPSAIRKLARTFHWTSSAAIQATMLGNPKPSASAQRRSRAVSTHMSPSLSAQPWSAKRARRSILSISDLFVQLPPLDFALAALAARYGRTGALTGSSSTALHILTVPPAIGIAIQTPNPSKAVINVGGVKPLGGSVGSTPAPDGGEDQNRIGGSLTLAAPSHVSHGAGSSGGGHVLVISPLSKAGTPPASDEDISVFIPAGGSQDGAEERLSLTENFAPVSADRLSGRSAGRRGRMMEREKGKRVELEKQVK